MSPISATFILSLFTSFLAVAGAPALDAGSLKQNGISAQQLNAQFASIKKTDACDGSAMACVEGAFAQCVGSKWVLTECTGGTRCFVLPLVNKVGTSITCDTETDASSRITNTGTPGGPLGTTSQASSFAVNGTDINGADCTDGTDDSNSGSIDSNSTTSALGITNGTSAATGNDTSSSNSGSISASNSSDCSSPTTVGVVAASPSTTEAALLSVPLTFTQTNSATLAAGVTLPPAATSTPGVVSPANASSIATSASTDCFSSTTSSSDPYILPTPTTGFENTTITLTPASASAFLSSLAVSNSGIFISTLSDSASAATATPSYVGGIPDPVAANGNDSGLITLSLFSTSLAATGTPVSLAATATSSSDLGGYSGYGYRRGVRRV